MVKALITGTPGVGKTTIARLLADRINCLVISMGELATSEGLVTGYDEERDSYMVDVSRLKKRIDEILSGCSNAVVEGHIPCAVSSEHVDYVIVLRLHPEALEARLRNRGYPECKVKENVLVEILDTCLQEALECFEDDKVFEIDTTGRSPEEIIDEIVKIISSGLGPRPGSVDWISKLEKNGKLDKYLSF